MILTPLYQYQSKMNTSMPWSAASAISRAAQRGLDSSKKPQEGRSGSAWPLKRGTASRTSSHSHQPSPFHELAWS